MGVGMKYAEQDFYPSQISPPPHRLPAREFRRGLLVALRIPALSISFSISLDFRITPILFFFRQFLQSPNYQSICKKKIKKKTLGENCVNNISAGQ